MRKPFVLLALLAACNQIAPSLGGDQADAGAPPPDAAPAVCAGFRDITGACLDPSCLGTAACAAAQPETCGNGVNGPGSCFTGICVFPNPAQGCGNPGDCACGLCGADGRCYTDSGGGCGSCAGGPSGAAGGAGSTKSPTCSACLSNCQGTGPSCCAGSGCICESQCGPYL